MKLKKNILAMTLSLALAVTAFAGCGSEKTDNTDNTDNAATEAPADTEGEATDASGQTASKDDNGSSGTIKDAYKDMFSIGAAVNSWQLADKDTMDVIKREFSSITCENEMKPDAFLDMDASKESGEPEIRTDNVDKIMDMAEDAGLKMRGHTLVWHSQTPEWLFHEDFDESKDYVDKDTMLARMETYIKKVLTFCKEEHPGLVYAWDVVNECASDDKGLREDSPWFKTIGEEYIEKAFEFARKYAEDGVKLYLNDYSTESPDKRNTLFEVASNLHEKGLIDGFGMQSHHDRQYFDAEAVKTTIMKFAQLEGLEIQLTELDMHYNENTDEAMAEQADMYKQLFDVLVEMEIEEFADITNVTFWGLNDSCTWLTNFKGEDSYPLILDENNQPKPCYNSILEALSEAE